MANRITSHRGVVLDVDAIIESSKRPLGVVDKKTTRKSSDVNLEKDRVTRGFVPARATAADEKTLADVNRLNVSPKNRKKSEKVKSAQNADDAVLSDVVNKM